MIPKSKGINKKNYPKKKKKKPNTIQRMKLKLEEEMNDFTQDDNQTTFQKRKLLVSQQYLYRNTLLDKF